jgi:hypothetical protein
VRRATTAALATLAALAACKRGGDASSDAGAAPAASSFGGPPVVAEVVPRCRAEGPAVQIPGDDVVLGEVVALPEKGAFAFGLTRRADGKRVASVARLPADLTTVSVVDVGPALGDAPPPLPRVVAGALVVAFYARSSASGPEPKRELRLARVDEKALATPAIGVVEQQADESFAFDVAWPETKDGEAPSPPVVVWDEDAPRRPGAVTADRGVVKVQLASPSASGGGASRVASREGSDAEEPRVIARPGGGVLVAWLSRRSETSDAGDPGEGPGERRAFRWVEAALLDSKGDPRGAARSVTSERGRAASFELVRSASEVAALVVDEAAHAEGAGARLLRVTIAADRVETTELLDGGVAHGAADLLPSPLGAAALVASASALSGEPGARWLAWNDTAERTVIAPLSRALVLAAPASVESSLAGARLLAAIPGGVLAATSAGGDRAEGARRPGAPLELRRFVCR